MKKAYVLPIILFVVATLCIIYLYKEYATEQQEVQEYVVLKEKFNSTVNPQMSIDVTDFTKFVDTRISSNVRSGIDFNALKQINPDTVGWITIPNTPINYPVVQATDNAKYLSTSFQGNRSKAGTIFIDCNNNVEFTDQNTVLYGHNMGGGRQDMFGGLLHYKDKKYFAQNPLIQLDTPSESGVWQVFAVLHLNIANSDFNYLQQTFSSEVEFEKWLDTAKELSLVQTYINSSNRQKVLSLSTCDRSKFGQDGRLVVMAMKLN